MPIQENCFHYIKTSQTLFFPFLQYLLFHPLPLITFLSSSSKHELEATVNEMALKKQRQNHDNRDTETRGERQTDRHLGLSVG